MRKPDPAPDRPEVIDLNARRRAAEVRKQALKVAKPRRALPEITPVTAWAILLAVALLWTLVGQLLK